MQRTGRYNFKDLMCESNLNSIDCALFVLSIHIGCLGETAIHTREHTIDFFNFDYLNDVELYIHQKAMEWAHEYMIQKDITDNLIHNTHDKFIVKLGGTQPSKSKNLNV